MCEALCVATGLLGAAEAEAERVPRGERGSWRWNKVCLEAGPGAPRPRSHLGIVARALLAAEEDGARRQLPRGRRTLEMSLQAAAGEELVRQAEVLVRPRVLPGGRRPAVRSGPPGRRHDGQIAGLEHRPLEFPRLVSRRRDVGDVHVQAAVRPAVGGAGLRGGAG